MAELMSDMWEDDEDEPVPEYDPFDYSMTDRQHDKILELLGRKNLQGTRYGSPDFRFDDFEVQDATLAIRELKLLTDLTRPSPASPFDDW